MNVAEAVPTEYDESTCFTAGELRETGMRIPPSVPDCAWIPRKSIRFGSLDVAVDLNPRLIVHRATVSFEEPFRWVGGSFSFTID